MSDNTYEIDVVLNSLDLGQASNKFKTDLQNLTTTLQQESDVAFTGVGKSMKGSLSKGLGKANVYVEIALQLAKIGQEAYEFQVEFEGSMRKVQAISKETQNDFDGMSEKILNLSANSSVSAIDLANAYRKVVEAGYDGADGFNILENSLKLSTIGVADIGTAIYSVTSMLEYFELDASHAGSIAAAMFETIKNGDVTFDELAGNLNAHAQLVKQNLEANLGAVESLDKAYETVMDSTSNKWTEVGNKWKRAISPLGKVLNEVSGDIAEALNYLLTNTQTDIIDPGAKKIVDNLVGSISTLSDKESKLEAIKSKINELNADSEANDMSVSALEDSRDGWFVRTLDYLGSGNMGKLPKDYVIKQQQKTFNEDTEINKLAVKHLLDLYEKVKQAEDKANAGGLENKTRSLNHMLADLNKLKGELGEGTEEHYLDTLSKMEEVRDEIREYYQNIRDSQEVDPIDPIEPISTNEAIEDAFGIQKKITEETVKQEFQSEKLTKWAEKRRKAAQKEADAIKEENDQSMKQEVFAENLQETLKIAKQIGDAFSEWGGAFGDIGGMISGIAGEAENLQTVLDKDASSTDKTVAAIQAGIKLVSIVANSAAERRKAEREFRNSIIQQEREYKLLGNDKIRTQYEESSNIFSTNYKAKLESGIGALSDANTNYLASLNELSDGRAKKGLKNANNWKNIGAGVGAGAAIGTAIVPVVGTVIGGVVGGLVGLFGGKKKKNKYEDLLTLYPELIDKNVDGQKKLNVELAKTLIDQKLVNDETAKSLQNAIDWSEQLEEAQKQLNDTISELAGDLGNNLADALVGAFENGEDAAKAFGDSVSNTLENVISKLLFDEVFADSLENLQTGMQESFEPKGDGTWVDDLGLFFEQSPELIKRFYEGLENAQDEAGEYGLNLFGPDSSSQPGLKGAVRRELTEETAGELAGIFRRSSDDIRKQGELMIESNNTLTSIAFNTGQTADNTAQTVNELKTVVLELQAINSNTKPTQTGRDLGV